MKKVFRKVSCQALTFEKKVNMMTALDDKLKVIGSVFRQAYFGHVMVEKAIWDQLEHYLECYLAAGENEENRNKIKTNYSSKLSDELAKAVQEGSFPVCSRHHDNVINRLTEFFQQHSVHFPSGNLRPKFPAAEDEYIYKTFDRGHGIYVTLLEENKDIIGHGTTGLTSWQGALFMADWCQAKGDLLKGKKVLELGAGVGMLGITLLKALDIGSYTFTDCHVNVLNFLVHNLEQNFAADDVPEDELLNYRLRCIKVGPKRVFHPEDPTSKSFHQKVGGSDYRAVVERLDWTDPAEELMKKDFHILLGSDIVYERSLIAPLCHVLHRFLRKGNVAYIACTQRSATTLECFETQMKDKGLNFNVVAKGSYSPTENILCSDVSHQPTRIYEIMH